MIQVQNTNRPDIIGATTSTLCAIHCIAAPFLFLATAGTATVLEEPPGWYHSLDYLFLIVSLIAVYFATKNSAKNWVKNALWITWLVLLMAILNETFEAFSLPEASVYIPALAIAGLHLYNRKHCKCNGTDCCVETGQ